MCIPRTLNPTILFHAAGFRGAAKFQGNTVCQLFGVFDVYSGRGVVDRLHHMEWGISGPLLGAELYNA